LPDARIKKHKKTHYLCEVANKREAKERTHDKRVCTTYGLKPGEYKKLYDAQDGKCAIKGCNGRGIHIALAVDHDHAKGLGDRTGIRGLLCKRHNKWIGEAGDDPLVFLSIYYYLKDPPAREILGE
jgi:hypothetical protein